MTTFPSTVASPRSAHLRRGLLRRGHLDRGHPRQASPRRASARLPVKLPVELAVSADRHAELPLTEQIAAQLRDGLAAAGSAPGNGCPPPARWPPRWA